MTNNEQTDLSQKHESTENGKIEQSNDEQGLTNDE